MPYYAFLCLLVPRVPLLVDEKVYGLRQQTTYNSCQKDCQKDTVLTPPWLAAVIGHSSVILKHVPLHSCLPFCMLRMDSGFLVVTML
jgi:hypothetical protein